MRFPMRLIAALALLCTPLLAAEPFERLLPPETAIYLSAENAARSLERLKENPLWKLREHPEIRDGILADLLREWERFVEESRAEGVEVDEFVTMLDGQIALALVLPHPESGRGTGVLLLADVGEQTAKLQEMLKRADAAVAKGKRRTEEEFRGVTIVSLLAEDVGGGDGAGGQEACGEGCDEGCWEGCGDEYATLEKLFEIQDDYSYFAHEGLFALASDPELLKQALIRRGDASGESLASRRDYAAVRAKMGGRPDLVAYCDVKAFLDLLMPEMAAETPVAIMQGILASGLGNLEAAGMQLALGKSSLELQMYLHTPAGKAGLLKLFDAPNAPLDPPGFVPADVVSFTALAIDIPALWQEARRMADRMQPGMSAMLDASLAAESQQLGVDLQKDVMGAIGKRLHFYQVTAEAGAPGVIPIPAMVFALDVAERERFEKALDALCEKIPPGFLEVRDYLGTELRLLALPMPMQPAFALLPGQLVCAFRVEDLQVIVAGLGKETKGLAGSPGYARAMARMPASRMMVSYSDQARALGQVQDLWSALGMFDERFRPLLKALVGAADVAAGVMVNDEEGILIVQEMLLKEPGAK
ncbi:MAG: hypothetical protein ACT4PV_10385 [Planctomycetaceae bacterium]